MNSFDEFDRFWDAFPENDASGETVAGRGGLKSRWERWRFREEKIRNQVMKRALQMSVFASEVHLLSLLRFVSRCSMCSP